MELFDLLAEMQVLGLFEGTELEEPAKKEAPPPVEAFGGVEAGIVAGARLVLLAGLCALHGAACCDSVGFPSSAATIKSSPRLLRSFRALRTPFVNSRAFEIVADRVALSAG